MKNKLRFNFYTLILSLFISFCFNKTVAQENGFYEVVEKSSTQSKQVSKKDSKEDRDGFYSLTYNLHPTAYIANNAIKIGGNSGYDNLPITKLTFNDTKSLNILNAQNPDFYNVELMTIKVMAVADLNNRLDLTDIIRLNKLKYILVECYFECTESQIEEFITNDDSGVRIFYKVSKPS
jgi:hypothetical protein